jgi:hypothetical protein
MDCVKAMTMKNIPAKNQTSTNSLVTTLTEISLPRVCKQTKSISKYYKNILLLADRKTISDITEKHLEFNL